MRPGDGACTPWYVQYLTSPLARDRAGAGAGLTASATVDARRTWVLHRGSVRSTVVPFAVALAMCHSPVPVAYSSVS